MGLEKVDLVVCDLDGTLLNDEKQVDPYLKKALQDKRLDITFASGRNYHIIQDLIEEFDITLPYITNNGANIFLKDECIYQKNIELHELEMAIMVLKKYQIPFIIYSINAVYYDGKSEGLDRFMQRLIGKCTINPLPYKIEDDIFKVVMIGEETVMNQVIEDIHKECHNTQCVRSENDIYTISHKLVSKGNALQFLMDFLHKIEEEVIVFGDNYNDVSMFNIVENSVCMDNATDVVKQMAKYQAKSNNDFGVSQFIEANL